MIRVVENEKTQIAIFFGNFFKNCYGNSKTNHENMKSKF